MLPEPSAKGSSLALQSLEQKKSSDKRYLAALNRIETELINNLDNHLHITNLAQSAKANMGRFEDALSNQLIITRKKLGRDGIEEVLVTYIEDRYIF